MAKRRVQRKPASLHNHAVLSIGIKILWRVCAAEIGAREVGTVEGGLREAGAVELCLLEVGASELSAPEAHSPKAGALHDILERTILWRSAPGSILRASTGSIGPRSVT